MKVEVSDVVLENLEYIWSDDRLYCHRILEVQIIMFK